MGARVPYKWWKLSFMHNNISIPQDIIKVERQRHLASTSGMLATHLVENS